jgi:hypothetical protein
MLVADFMVFGVALASSIGFSVGGAVLRMRERGSRTGKRGGAVEPVSPADGGSDTGSS